MEFSRQEYWSGLPCPPPGDLPNPGTERGSLTSSALAGRFFTTRAPWETYKGTCLTQQTELCTDSFWGSGPSKVQILDPLTINWDSNDYTLRDYAHNVTFNFDNTLFWLGFPAGSEGKASACNAGDLCLIPKTPIQYTNTYIWNLERW